MKSPSKKSASASAAAKRSSEPASARQTIAHTLVTDQNDSKHHPHAPGPASDRRVAVAIGERLQRVRARAQAN